LSTYTCPFCKKEFTPRSNYGKDQQPPKYCSKQCAGKAQWFDTEDDWIKSQIKKGKSIVR
jgi:hypothetical protein